MCRDSRFSVLLVYLVNRSDSQSTFPFVLKNWISAPPPFCFWVNFSQLRHKVQKIYRFSLMKRSKWPNRKQTSKQTKITTACNYKFNAGSKIIKILKSKITHKFPEWLVSRRRKKRLSEKKARRQDKKICFIIAFLWFTQQVKKKWMRNVEEAAGVSCLDVSERSRGSAELKGLRTTRPTKAKWIHQRNLNFWKLSEWSSEEYRIRGWRDFKSPLQTLCSTPMDQVSQPFCTLQHQQSSLCLQHTEPNQKLQVRSLLVARSTEATSFSPPRGAERERVAR